MRKRRASRRPSRATRPARRPWSTASAVLALRVGTLPLHDLETRFLRAEFINAERIETGGECAEFLRLYDYDLLLIDNDLPDMTGAEVIRRVRAAGFDLPTIVLTAGAPP